MIGTIRERKRHICWEITCDPILLGTVRFRSRSRTFYNRKYVHHLTRPDVLNISSSQQQQTHVQEIRPIRGSSLLVRLLSGGRPDSPVVFLIKSMKQLSLLLAFEASSRWLSLWVRLYGDQRVSHDYINHTHTNTSNVYMPIWKHTWYNFKNTKEQIKVRKKKKTPTHHPSPVSRSPPPSILPPLHSPERLSAQGQNAVLHWC